MAAMETEDPTPALEYAADCARHGRTDLLLEFLDAGYPVDQPDVDGNTPLMLAAYHGQTATVAALLDRGADPDRLNARGQAPVAGALFKGEDDVVRLLVAAGADLDHGSPTARETAALFGSDEHLFHP